MRCPRPCLLPQQHRSDDITCSTHLLEDVELTAFVLQPLLCRRSGFSRHQRKAQPQPRPHLEFLGEPECVKERGKSDGLGYSNGRSEEVLVARVQAVQSVVELSQE